MKKISEIQTKSGLELVSYFNLAFNETITEMVTKYVIEIEAEMQERQK